MPILDTILAGLGLVGQAAQAITDPSLNEALSPASGLIVSPYYFQSIETEGRWKHQARGGTCFLLNLTCRKMEIRLIPMTRLRGFIRD